MFKDLPSSKCPGSVGSSMLDLESRGQGSIPNKGGVIFCFKFYNPNLHNKIWQNKVQDEKPEYVLHRWNRKHYGLNQNICCKKTDS